MASSRQELPPDAEAQVKLMRALEVSILADADRRASGVDPSTSVGVAGEVGVDPATAGKAGLARLDKELRELTQFAEEQVRPDVKSVCLDALAERIAARDAIRQMLRDLAVKQHAVRPAKSDRSARAELLGEGRPRSGVGVDSEREKNKPPSNETAALNLAQQSTESLRRSRAMMGEELEKGKLTLALMEQSLVTMKKTNDEHDGEQRFALFGGGKMLTRLERQAVWERYTLWGGFFCFITAAAHVVLKRTPVLVRFHPLWWIRHAAVRREKAAAKQFEAAKKANPPATASATTTQNTHTPTPLATLVALATEAVASAIAHEHVMDVIHAETYLASIGTKPPEDHGALFSAGEVEVGEYSADFKTEL